MKIYLLDFFNDWLENQTLKYIQDVITDYMNWEDDSFNVVKGIYQDNSYSFFLSLPTDVEDHWDIPLTIKKINKFLTNLNKVR